MSPSRIEWTDETWNPVLGCSRVSPGCDNCYAISMSARIAATGNEAYQGVVADGDWTGLLKPIPERFEQPLRWKKPRMVFVNSMSDLFHPDISSAVLAHLFDVMREADRHVFQILTKRPQRMAALLNGGVGGGPLPSHIWLGTSIESDRYVFRADHLRLTDPGVRFLSLEPLLGPLPSLDLSGIGWVIVGGESGPNHRPIDPNWVRDIRDRSVAAGVPFFFKQWGGRTPKAGGRELDGAKWSEMPWLVSAKEEE